VAAAGRKTKHIEAATELSLVAQPRQGSFTLDLELAPLPEGQLAKASPHVGEQALDALVAAMPEPNPRVDTLPHGFDNGGLRNRERISPVLRRATTRSFSRSPAHRIPGERDSSCDGSGSREPIPKPVRARDRIRSLGA
jgi:hypothetical protein